MTSTSPSVPTLDELQADADRTWVPDPILVAEGLGEIAEKVYRRAGPSIPGSGPEVFLNPQLHDAAVGAEAGFSAEYLGVTAFRADDERRTVYVDARCDQMGYRAVDLMRELVTHVHGGAGRSGDVYVWDFDLDNEGRRRRFGTDVVEGPTHVAGHRVIVLGRCFSIRYRTR